MPRSERRFVDDLRGLPLAVVLPALAVLVLAVLGDRPVPGLVAAAIGLTASLLPLRGALACVFALASHPGLGHGTAIGPLAALDILVIALCLRLAIRWIRPLRSPTPPQVAVAIAILVGAAATAKAGFGVTAYLRVASYLTLAGLAVASMRASESRAAIQSFVGVAIGQAVAALVGITETIPTGLPLGRYLGTYGDPFQFGIAMAAAALIVADAPRLSGIGPRLRWPLTAVLIVGLMGSNTRGVWGATLIAAIAIAAVRMQRARSQPWLRFGLGFVLGASLVALVAAVTIAAPALGLNSISTRIRVDSITETWAFFVENPLSPQGLGNYPARLPAFNTILALSVALTPLFVLALMAFAIASLRSASEHAETGLFGALVAFVATTLTENLVYAGSAATVAWLVLCAAESALAPAAVTPERVPGRRRRDSSATVPAPARDGAAVPGPAPTRQH